ncbi:MAG: HAD-IB family phosphatase [Candidatus Brocadiia bacterium]|nr:HAD-IB family phosphatase [Candidatus Brocadiia bacterium]
MADGKIKLVAFDMEGVLSADPTVWEIMHGKLGTWDSHGRPYWERYQAGEFGYDRFARMDVAVWRGADVGLLREAAREVRWTDGCAEVLGALAEAGVAAAVISSGLLCVASRLEDEFGIEPIFANRAMAEGERLTGEVDMLVPYEAKGGILRSLAARGGIERAQIAAVGDSHSDVAMFREAAVSVAFRPTHASVASAATYCIDGEDLRPLLAFLL